MENIKRILYTGTLLLLSILERLYEWMLQETKPELNAGIWIAAIWGSFFGKILRPTKTLKQTTYSFLLSYLGTMYAVGIIDTTIDSKKAYSFFIALFLDGIIRGVMWLTEDFATNTKQFISWLIEIVQKIRNMLDSEWLKTVKELFTKKKDG